MRKFGIGIVLLAWGGLFCLTVPAQEDARALWDTAFQSNQQRPKAAKPAAKRPARRQYARVQRAKPDAPVRTAVKPAEKFSVPEGMEAREIAVTMWRLRPARKTDPKDTRILVQDAATNAASAEWTPERIAAGAPLAEGERVRMSVMTPKTGFLYVFDREKYADGTFSEPYLIFPTTRTNGGDNRITAGTPVEIPAFGDNPNYFSIRELPNQSGKVLVGEELSILVTDQPLDGVTVGASAQKVDESRFAEIRKFETGVDQFELVNGKNLPYQSAEKLAATGGARMLTQDDPLPQSIFRAVTARGTPLLVSVPLFIGSKTQK